MNLTERPTNITWPKSPYIFIEAIGPFQQTAPMAWQTLHKNLEAIRKQCKVTGFTSLYKPEELIYRAGVTVDEKTDKIPANFQFTTFAGGKYAKFVYTGSYAQIPQACGRVFELVQSLEIKVGDNFYIENYVNDPNVTPEDKLVTEILVPLA